VKRRPSLRWFAISALIVLCAFPVFIIGSMFLASGDLEPPERKNWSSNKDEFAALVAAMPPEPISKSTESQVSFPIPERVGAYTTRGYGLRVQGGAIFHDDEGCSFIDDSGFAYLPDGPYAELENGNFESPQFRALGDGWYSFCASW
jgi:hypothetical protein